MILDVINLTAKPAETIKTATKYGKSFLVTLEMPVLKWNQDH